MTSVDTYFTGSLNLVCAHQELGFMVLLFVLVDCRVCLIEIDWFLLTRSHRTVVWSKNYSLPVRNLHFLLYSEISFPQPTPSLILEFNLEQLVTSVPTRLLSLIIYCLWSPSWALVFLTVQWTVLEWGYHVLSREHDGRFLQILPKNSVLLKV